MFTIQIEDEQLIAALARPEILEALRDLLQPDILNMEQACERFHCSSKTLTRAMKARLLPDNRIGGVGKHFWTLPQLTAWRLGLDL